jgi:hypothetical protein
MMDEGRETRDEAVTSGLSPETASKILDVLAQEKDDG